MCLYVILGGMIVTLSTTLVSVLLTVRLVSARCSLVEMVPFTIQVVWCFIVCKVENQIVYKICSALQGACKCDIADEGMQPLPQVHKIEASASFHLFKTRRGSDMRTHQPVEQNVLKFASGLQKLTTKGLNLQIRISTEYVYGWTRCGRLQIQK